MAAMGLPGTDLGQLRRQAKDWLRRGRDGDAEALSYVRRLHPRGEELAADPSRLRLADAQLALARAYGFASWPRLRAHLQRVEPWRRRPHQVGVQTEPADELLRLACLTYGADDRSRTFRAAELLAARPDLATANVYTAAATGSIAALDRFLADDPSLVGRAGGPHGWVPLLYLSYSRLADDAPARSSLESARRLLEAGADPNAGFLWEGLAPPFTALTGAFGGGENWPHEPPHQHAQELAELLLEAGADPNDGQALYNRMFRPGDGHLELLFRFGLGRGDGGPWRHRLGTVQQSPAEMLADQLIWAVQAGRTSRVALLLRHGVDPNVPGSGHPTHEVRSAYAWALRLGSADVADLLRAAGARPPAEHPDEVDRFLAAALAGDVETVQRAEPAVRTAAVRRRPGAAGEAVELRRPESVRLLVAAGFNPNGNGDPTPLHLAAFGGDLELVRLLVEVGADPTRRDPTHSSTPLGWAEHAGADDVAAYLRGVSPHS
jgi:Ankyrin repeats (3 copies)